MITDKKILRKSFFKKIIVLLIAYSLTGCSLTASVAEEVPSKVSLNQLSTFETESEISHLKFVDALNQVLIITENGGIFLDVKTGEKVSHFSGNGEINKVELDSSGELLMVGSRDQVQIINITDKNTVWDKRDEGNSGDQISAFAPDGNSVYAFSKIWGLDNNVSEVNVFYPAAPMSSEISKDSRFLLNTGLYGKFDLIDLKTGDYIHRWDSDRYVAGGAFSPDSKYIFIVNGAKSQFSVSKKLNIIDVYDLSSKKKIKELTHNGNISSFNISRSGEGIFLGTEEGEIYHWSAKTFEKKGHWKDKGWVHASASDDTGRVWFGYETGKLKLYDPERNALSTVVNSKVPITKIGASKKGDVLAIVKAEGQKRKVAVFQVIGM